MKSRTRARSVALQALYELDMTDHVPGDVLMARLAEFDLNDDLVRFTFIDIFIVL